MIAAVFSVPGAGPQQVWLLTSHIPDSSDDILPTAVVPGGAGPQADVFARDKGDAVPWLDWAEQLSESPWLGRWSIQSVPDGMDAHEALGYVRDQAIERALNG